MVRSLNGLGLESFRGYLARLRTGGAESPPVELLEDPRYAGDLEVEISVEPRAWKNRFELARYLNERLVPLGPEVVDRDVGLWARLSLAYFDQVCPPAAGGARRPGQDYRHIPEFSYRYQYRHLLQGPFHVYRRHGVRSIALLSGPVHTESKVYHEIASRQDLIANRGVIEAALLLYFDPRHGRLKRGAQTTGRQGTVQRFVHVLQQLDVTYDIYGLAGRQIVELLPAEFDQWRPRRQLQLTVRAAVRGGEQAGREAPPRDSQT